MCLLSQRSDYILHWFTLFTLLVEVILILLLNEEERKKTIIMCIQISMYID